MLVTANNYTLDLMNFAQKQTFSSISICIVLCIELITVKLHRHYYNFNDLALTSRRCLVFSSRGFCRIDVYPIISFIHF